MDKIWLRRIGAVVSALCVAFVLWKLYAVGADLRPILLKAKVLYGSVAYALVYGCLLFVLAYCWALLVKAAGRSQELRLMALTRAYGISSIAKYVPGNVFHFVGRQWMARKLPTGQAQLLVASAVEIMLHLIAALLVASVLMLVSRGVVSAQISSSAKLLAGALVALTLIVASPTSRSWLSKSLGIVTGNSEVRMPGIRTIATVGAMCGLFFTAMAAIAAGCYQLLQPLNGQGAFIGASFLLAFIAGYVVPGAPGGMGVREAALLGLLGVIMPQAVALSLALLIRFVTIVGDLVFFAISHLITDDPLGNAANTNEGQS
jgi:uncharacterized membrane protein YbhN (UPF0104 family)